MNKREQKILNRHQIKSYVLFGYTLLVFILPSAGWSDNGSPTPSPVPVNAKSTPNPSGDLSMSPQEEIQVLDAIDDSSNTATAASKGPTPSTGTPQPTVAPMVSGPPPAPTGVKLMNLKEGVYLSWDVVPGTSQLTAYNVYRSTTPGEGYRLVNLKPLSSPYFLDGIQNSLSPPRNKEDYFYVVAAVDPQGNVSPYSEESTITPVGMDMPPTEEEKKESQAVTATKPDEEKVLDVPAQKIINLQLPADTQLSIQGYKKISAVLTFQNYYNRPTQGTGLLQQANNTAVNQELVVNLQGKVGKNVDVNVDYSDVNRNNGVDPGVDQSKQNISIVYHGNSDSPIQEVSFGDLQLYLPNTEFAGFNKQLFGLQGKFKFDNLHLTTFFAQTKGISETKVFTGNSVQIKTDIPDINYLRYKYFFITRLPYYSQGVTTNQLSTTVVYPQALPQNNSEQIWVDSANGQTAPPNDPNFRTYAQGVMEHWLPGRDYTMDYSTGIITFIRGLSQSSRIAVAYVDRNGSGTYIGFTSPSSGVIDLNPANLQVDPFGVVSTNGVVSGGVSFGGHLIKDNVNPAAVPPNYLLNYFDLGRDKIVPPQQDPGFVFQIIDQGTNNVLQTGANGPWAFNVNLDLNFLTVTNTSAAFAAPTTFFPERPFANNDSSGGTGNSDVYSQTSTPLSTKRIHLEYKTQLNFFRLDRFNIIKSSETVYLDGRRLRRDVDYSFDYTSGFLDFLDKSILTPQSQVVVTYEYAPFGTFGQSNILGARAEYDLTDHFFIGSTFLSTTTQQPIDVPQIGSTPNSLTVLDADAKYDIGPDEIQSITGIIPGLENWKPPLSIKLSGEVAQSTFNPDTFNAEGENGVAMVDNMQGIDSVTGTSMSSSSWLVSSAPQPVAFLPITQMVSASGPNNNRVRFFDNTSQVDFQVNTTTSQDTNGGIAGGGGYLFAQTNQPTDRVSVLEFPYSYLTNQTWAGLRQVISTTGVDLSNTLYLQSWVYNDGGDKWIMYDFGVISEDSNGNGGLDRDPNQVNNLPANPGYGIPTFYTAGTPWVYSGGSTINFEQDASGNWGYIGAPAVSNAPTQEGQNVGLGTSYVTEDMNGNGVLDTNDDSYFEYGVHANWLGWQQVKIPVNFTAADNQATTPEGISYFFHSFPSAGIPNAQAVRAVRVWTTGTATIGQHGYFLMENISFEHNQWQLEVDPQANVNQGVTTNISKFDVNSISQVQDARFNPTLRFITVQTGQNQTTILTQEKALQITYNLSSADFEPSGNINGKPIYYATRNFGQGLDFTDYQQLRFDLEVKSFQQGDVIFIRLGNDQLDYFQFNIQLNSTYQDNWNNVVINLDGSDGNMEKVGTPYINRSTQISFGVLSPNAPSARPPGELWIANLRTVNPNSRSGLARRLNATINLGDNFATVNARYREVDSGFLQMDQTSTHFQHSTQLGTDYNSNSVKLFGQPLVTQFSITHQDLYTEDALAQNPYYLNLPNSSIENTTGSIGYTKDLGPGAGRLTNVKVSGSTNYETDVFQPDYLSQPGVQGNIQKGQANISDTITYDAPTKFFFIPIGTNQFNQTFTLTHDTQEFTSNDNYANYDRTTRIETYGWTNTTELFKNLVFTPGFNLSLTDAVGNTNSPGVPGGSVTFTPFQQRYQPKVGVTFKGIPGITPGVDYTGSNQYDFVSFQDGTRFNSANTINYSLNLSPGNWIPLLQKINLTLFGGRTETATQTIPSFGTGRPLTFDQQWLTNPNLNNSNPNNLSPDLNGTKSISHQVNASFKLFDVWDFRPTGSFTNQLSLLSQGSNPVEQVGDTLGLTTIYNRKIFTIPFIMFNLNSAQFQYTQTDNTQFDSSDQQNIDTQTKSQMFSMTFPYDINQKAQGNIRLQRTVGVQNTRGVFTYPYDDQATIEYNQKFAPNMEIHIPFTHWKLKLQDAIELRLTFLMEFINNQSDYIYNVIQSERYRGTIALNYNALKNLRVGIELDNEYFTNDLNPQLDYVLWQGTVSAEARF